MHKFRFTQHGRGRYGKPKPGPHPAPQTAAARQHGSGLWDQAVRMAPHMVWPHEDASESMLEILICFVLWCVFFFFLS